MAAKVLRVNWQCRRQSDKILMCLVEEWLCQDQWSS